MHQISEFDPERHIIIKAGISSRYPVETKCILQVQQPPIWINLANVCEQDEDTIRVAPVCFFI